jgi:hypothetical protein
MVLGDERFLDAVKVGVGVKEVSKMKPEGNFNMKVWLLACPRSAGSCSSIFIDPKG